MLISSFLLALFTQPKRWLAYPLLAASIVSVHVAATPLPPVARQEVVTLLERLAASGCQFNRNGTWYTAAEAKTHLLRKLDYVEKNTSLSTAEAFIEAAATRSSMSGTAYQVRCGNAQAQPSAQWLLHELALERAPKKRLKGPRQNYAEAPLIA